VPTREQVRAILGRIRRGSDAAFFFRELSSPDWIGPLRDEGLFESPPMPIVEGDLVSYPDWPAARYLERMASQAPEQVLEVIQGVPDVENPRVYDAFVEAALEMPPEIASHLAPDVARWVRNDRHAWLLPHRAAELTERLVLAGEVSAALDVAKALFQVDESTSDNFLSPPVAVHIGTHELEDVLEKLWRPLIASAGLDAFELFLAGLSSTLDRRRGEQRRPPFEDYSQIWWPSIADTAESTRQPESIFLSAVTRGAELLLEEGGSSGRKAFRLLAQGEWKVMRRVALYLVGRFPERVVPSVAARLVIAARTVRDPAYGYELQEAIRALFPSLSDAQRARYLEIVRDGPPASLAVRRRAEGDWEWEEYVARWQARRIVPIVAYLSGQDEAWASEILADKDSDGLLSAPPRTTATWVGPTSPLNAAEVAELTVEGVVSYLSEWQPSGEWASPSREGLARTLTSVIADSPSRFADSAAAFVGQDPTYVRALLSGIREGLVSGSSVSWSSVLTLLEWVTQQQLATERRDWRHEDRDPGWGWTWTDAARLLSEGMTRPSSGLTRRSAGRVWLVLTRLTENPEPTEEYEAEFGGDNMDPATLAINTGRGEAVNAVVRYAWWQSNGEGPVATEVRSLLALHADPHVEKSLAVHSVYGRWLGTLLALDPDWVAGLLELIFPAADDLSRYWQAAWDSFVLFGRPSTRALEMLDAEYRRAFRDELRGHTGRHAEDIVRMTAHHVASYYLWGIQDLSDDGSLIQSFMREAPEAARASLITLSGRLLRGDEDGDDALSPEQVGLLKDLWSDRRRRFELAPTEVNHELSPFGWWCGAKRLEVEWWLPQLDWLTKVGIPPDPDFQVLAALSEAAGQEPLLVVQVLRRLLDLHDGPWAWTGRQEELKHAVAVILGSRDSSAIEAARQLIHELGAREAADFSDLL
jgi:hypothetical protein